MLELFGPALHRLSNAEALPRVKAAVEAVRVDPNRLGCESLSSLSLFALSFPLAHPSSRCSDITVFMIDALRNSIRSQLADKILLLSLLPFPPLLRF